MSKDAIIEILKREKPFLVKTHHISELGLFGSFARGEDTTSSDVDILIEFEPQARISLFDLTSTKHYLEDSFGRSVDIVHKKMIKPALKKEILDSVVMI